MPSKKEELNETILAERLEAFTPEPLVESSDKSIPSGDDELEILAVDATNIDLAKTNFLNILNNEEIKQQCEVIVRKYGVGTCGPRAFYGTTDIHLELEKNIATFFDMEDALVYSYGFVAISSSVAAYCRKNDVVFTDFHCNNGIKQGLMMAKCKVVYFDRQQPESFQIAVQTFDKEEIGLKKKSRKFLVVEGTSWKTGKILNLPEFIKVAEDNKIRIFLEETYSIGVLGDKGQGLIEYFNIEPWRVDMIIATLEASIGSIGGFCAGSHMTIEPQRLSGSGYIFSASLPTYLVQACIESFKLLQTMKPHHQLRKLAVKFHDTLQEIGYIVESDPICPFKIVKHINSKSIHSYCINHGLHFILRPTKEMMINLNINLLENQEMYDQVENILRKAIKLT